MALPYPDNLVFHYDASETDSVTITDSKVSGLADLYNSYNLTQTNASLRPTLTTVDGVQCLQFGTGGAGQIHLLGSDLPLTGDATLIAKVRGNGTVINDRNGMFFEADSVGQCHFGGIGAVAGQWYESFGGAGTGFTNRTLLNIDVSSVSQGVWTTATIRRSGDTIYGGFDGTEGTGAGSIAGGWTSAYRIGQTTRNYHWNGYIAYMALYDRSLSAEEIAAVVAALESTTLSTGLQGWWCPSLDTSGNGTTTLTDLSGNGKNASMVNMDADTVADTDDDTDSDGNQDAWVIEDGLRALRFVATDSAKATTPHPTFGFGEDNFSVACWVKLETVDSGFVSPLIWGHPNFDGATWFGFQKNSSDQWRFVVDDNVTLRSVTNGSTVASGVWYHLVGTREYGGNIKFYLNNSLVGTVSDNGNSITSLSNDVLRFGYQITVNNPAGQEFLNGCLDQVGVWNRVITDDEVTQLYNGGRSLNLLSTGATIVPQLLLRRRRLFGGLVI